MKKIIPLLLLMIMNSASYGALSADMSEYVRKDVYDVQMQTLNANMERVLRKLDSLESKVNNMSDRITGLSGRVDGLDARMGDMQNYIYLLIVLLGIVVGLPTVQKMYQSMKETRPTVTLEDVKRLIDENSMRLKGNQQA